MRFRPSFIVFLSLLVGLAVGLTLSSLIPLIPMHWLADASSIGKPWIFHPFRSLTDAAHPPHRYRGLRTVPYINKEMVDASFRQAIRTVQPGDVLADASTVFVPHHLLAQDLIASSLWRAHGRTITRVLLVSPNHFDNGSASILMSAYDWSTPDGIVEADTRMIDSLAAESGAVVDEGPYEKEHGIYNILPFIKRAFPNAQVVPIIVKDRLPISDAQTFAAVLAKLADEHTLLVASFDFSHEQIDLSAQFHDLTSEEVLRSLSVEDARSLDIDSRPGIALAMAYAQARGTSQFELFTNKNASDYTHNADQSDVTSYVTGAYVPGAAQPSDHATILAFGDLMMDRKIRETIDVKGNDWPFAPMHRFLAGSDLTVANLEGTITDNAPKRLEPTSIVFTFDPSVAPTLARLGFDAFSQANNHSKDFGEDGFAQTHRYLDAAGLGSFGDFNNREDLSWVENVRGMKIGFVGVHTVYGRDASGALAEIKRLRPTVDTLIVYAHWGVEYQETASSQQRALAHQLVDAGADIVLGAHPHVVEPLEVYNGKLIAYSMGNFVFDQQFSAAVRHGLAIGLSISHDAVEVFLFPHTIAGDFQVHLDLPSQSQAFFKTFSQRSDAPQSVKTDMADGRFILPRL